MENTKKLKRTLEVAKILVKYGEVIQLFIQKVLNGLEEI